MLKLLVAVHLFSAEIFICQWCVHLFVAMATMNKILCKFNQKSNFVA